MPNTLTLFTNLEQLTINNVNLRCNALVLEQRANAASLRGFGATPSWLVFELHFTGKPAYKDRSSPAICTPPTTGKTPIFRAGILSIGNTAIQYTASDPAHPLDVFEIEDRDDHQILTVWQELMARVERYWTAPFIHVLSNRPTRQEQERLAGMYANGIAASNTPVSDRR